MIIMLLAIIFCISVVVCFIIARIFKAPLESILHRLILEDIGQAWLKYLQFAIYVVWDIQWGKYLEHRELPDS